MQQRPVTSDLFRFTTLRTPQLIDPARRDSGFIYISNEIRAKSQIIKSLSDDLPTAREELQVAVKNFRPVKNYLAVRELAPELYDFSHWLSKRRVNVTPAQVETKIAKVGSGLSAKNLKIVWDNLFYQLVVRNNPTVRQACSRLLVADNLLHHYKNTDFKAETPRTPKSPSHERRIELYLQRLANAKVVVPKAFSKDKEVGGLGGDLTDLKNGSDNLPNILDRFKRSQDIARSKSRLNTYKTIKNDVAKVRSEVDEDSAVSAISREADAENVTLKPITANLLNRDGVKKKTVATLETDIDESIRSTRNNLYLAARNTMVLNKAVDAEIKPLTSYLTISETDDIGTDAFLTIKTNKTGAKPISASYKLKQGGATVVSDTKVEVVDSGDDLLNVKLFPGKDINPQGNGDLTLTGKFVFDDNTEMEVEIPNVVLESPSVGAGSAGTAGSTGSTSSGVSSSQNNADGELYGVNRLGIGVFRKVEQEVCCYVPGEVSRIENIMAREYKERHTRSLSSSETTTEESTETEIENQTDTSSTVRNELQSEIAKVLEKGTDIGAGASAGVSGEYMGVTVSADGSFDYASANSASQSDTDAKTYAQEVVNNALERIVQKTS